MRNIQTIIFDLGGVYFTNGTRKAIDTISSRWNLDDVIVGEVFKGELGSKYRKGEISYIEFWKQTKEILKIDATIEELSEIWLSGYVPIQGTIDLIKELKDKGYEILYLSDNVQERIDYLEGKYHFLQYFKSGVFSHIVGVRKPNPKIYQLALEESSNPAENCVYIDDKYKFLEEAEKLGMATIQFINPDETRMKLRELGIDLDIKKKLE